MDSFDQVLKLLAFRKRHDLARLFGRGRLEFDVSSTYGSQLFSQLTRAEIYAPVEDCDRLRALSKEDKDLILNTLQEIHPPKPNDIEIVEVAFFVDPSSPTVVAMTDDELIEELEKEKAQMIAVATGGPRIQEVNEEYCTRRKRLSDALSHRGLLDPNPHDDLWDWYGKWSSGDLPTYVSRRQYLASLYHPLIDRLKRGAPDRDSIFAEPTGWARIDRTLTEIRKRLEEASTEEQFQAVGLLCREVLISLAETVYDPARHRSSDGVLPSKTDAKRMLEAYLSEELVGGSNEVARRHAKAALDLANELQHRRTATFRAAALCAEATSSVVNLIAIISGQRDP